MKVTAWREGKDAFDGRTKPAELTSTGFAEGPEWWEKKIVLSIEY